MSQLNWIQVITFERVDASVFSKICLISQNLLPWMEHFWKPSLFVNCKVMLRSWKWIAEPTKDSFGIDPAFPFHHMGFVLTRVVHPLDCIVIGTFNSADSQVDTELGVREEFFGPFSLIKVNL